MSNESMIKERLEHLKKYMYSEVNYLKARVTTNSQIIEPQKHKECDEENRDGKLDLNKFRSSKHQKAYKLIHKSRRTKKYE